MDYLSGKKSEQICNGNGGNNFSLKFTFLDFCKYTFNHLSSEEFSTLCGRYMKSEILLVLKDNELSKSVNAFFENNLNISETSRNAFLHRNTLLYRIKKIEKLTGLDIRKFDDAICFKILSVFYKKMNQKSKNK